MTSFRVDLAAVLKLACPTLIDAVQSVIHDRSALLLCALPKGKWLDRLALAARGLCWSTFGSDRLSFLTRPQGELELTRLVLVVPGLVC